jgi:predicted dehydrogenase
LLVTNKIDIGYLTTHQFEFQDAPKAFDLVVNRNEPFIGIVLKYDTNKTPAKETIVTSEVGRAGEVNVSFIGAGSYAQGFLLPNIPANDAVQRIGVMTNTGTTSKRVAEKFNFQFCTSKESDVLNDETNTLFIATRHDSHGPYVIKGLKHNKNIFVEKPLCLLESELDDIIKAQAKASKVVMVGFNRRFSPLTVSLKKALIAGPMTMIYRINAGFIPKNTWIQDMEIGGGRILGEVCHFIDYLTCINGSLPIKLVANVLPDTDNLNDTVNIMIQFANGSMGVIAYYANGSKSLSKEYVEVFSGGISVILNDFKELKIYGKRKHSKKKLFNQNKGQKEMVSAFIDGLLSSGKAPIPFDEIIAVTKASFKILESIKQGGQQIEIK